MMWVSGYQLAQMVAATLLLLGLVLAAFEGWPGDMALLVQVAEEVASSNTDWLLMALTGSATLGALFLILPAAFWRLGPSRRQVLGTHVPESRHLVLLVGAVLPLGILCDELYRVSSLLVEQLRLLLVERLPVLAELDISSDTISLIQSQTASTSFPLLVVIVGVGPAIGEEVIFRGLIGRGLIARRGVVRGVLLTSLLFALAHFSPAHAVATLPMAVFLHVAYLATGSIWAPILVHFLNNALSVTMMKFGLGQDVQVTGLLLIFAALYVTVTGVLLFKERPSWKGVLPAFSVGRPIVVAAADSSLSSAVPALSVTPVWLLVLAGSGVLGFTWSFVLAATVGG